MSCSVVYGDCSVDDTFLGNYKDLIIYVRNDQLSRENLGSLSVTQALRYLNIYSVKGFDLLITPGEMLGDTKVIPFDFNQMVASKKNKC